MSDEQTTAPPPASDPPAPPPPPTETSSADLLGIDPSPPPPLENASADLLGIDPSSPPPPPTEKASADLLGMNGDEDHQAVSPSGAAAKAVMEEALGAGSGTSPPLDAAAATAAAVNDDDNNDIDDNSIDTESDGSKITEESESSSDDSGSESESEDDDDDDDDDSNSDSEDSSSSEDPSIVGKMDMRKSPPETLGAIQSVRSTDSEDPELGVLTKDQVNAASSSLVSPNSNKPHQPPPSQAGKRMAVPSSSRLYVDENNAGNLDPHATKTGSDFYSAYGDVTRRMSGEGIVLSDDDLPLPTNRVPAPRRYSKNPEIGRDRATVRQMVAQRVKGKNLYSRSRRAKKGGKNSSRGDPRLEARLEGQSLSGINSGRMNSNRRRSSRALQRGRSREEEELPWYSNPRKRRICYAVLAAAIGVAGIFMIAYGASKEREYNRAQKDDDYYYNDDFGVTDDAIAALDDEELIGDISGSSPIHANPSLTPGSDSRPKESTLPPAPTPPPALPFSPLTSSPTPPKVVVEDDELLVFLKQSYASSLEPFGDDLAERYIDKLDSEIMADKPPAEQSLQWKAYRYLLEERTDVVNDGGRKLVVTLAMDRERILQVYALNVFYNTFGWEYYTVGDSECEWPGVSCRGLGVHSKLDNVKEDDLRVVALEVSGRNGPTPYAGPVLEGELPIELMFLADLETLDLSHNQIGGKLEKALFHWKNMKVMKLNDNRLEGDIPPALGYFSNLQKLTLHHNEFLGEVPVEICEKRESTLHFLWVDCSPMPNTNLPKVSCDEDCCTICFEGYDDDGGPETGGASPPGPGGQDTKHEVVNDALADLKTKLSDASSDKGAALMDTSSPQFRAYAWLVEDAKSVKDGPDDKYADEQLFQRYALATLYFATNGAQWSESEDWITPADECDWYGISGCEESEDAGYTDHFITAINLKENRLEGTIPPEIFEFVPSIITFNLATNQVSGPIPKEIGMLQDIDILELAENQLTSIPAEMGQLNTIDHVFLQANNFGGQEMPAQVCQLRTEGSLTLLWADCRGDQASLLCHPACCTTCFSGSTSSLSASPGSGDKEPGGITHADSDEEVLNRLKKSAPDNGESLNNALSPQFKAYTWLVGTDPTNDAKLSDILLLQRYAMATLYFGLAGHGWAQKDGWLSEKSACEWELVEKCNNVGMVTELLLYSNNLVGRIPAEITHIRMLELLDLTDNELYGTIPTEFGWFEDLEILRLGGNLLTGNIPSELGNLSTLHELYLHVNEFTATSVPNEICELRTDSGNGLSTFWTDCITNDFGSAMVVCGEDCCDECFGDDSDFTFYQGYEDTDMPTSSPAAPLGTVVPGRNFPPTASPVTTSAPTLPENPELKDDLLKHMKESPLFSDRLSDKNSHAYEAFLWLGSTPNFDELDEFHRLQRYGLATFYFSTNTDAGYPWKISESWNSGEHECNWFGVSCEDDNTVTEISLPGNRLSGTIPPEIELVGLGNMLTTLNLSGNNIGGKLAVQLGALKHLEVLDLKANDFTGQIPPEIGELFKLTSLELQANELTGVMPPEICQLREGVLDELITDCDEEDPFSMVTCEIDSCCSECY
mmetsp:Transcript_9984/g.21610  ORF Transcript_9984/g.21610 Transcript_9984/m.21610 type:complete len:1577 (+) Transcript_9984:140-4870(+)